MRGPSVPALSTFTSNRNWRKWLKFHLSTQVTLMLMN